MRWVFLLCLLFSCGILFHFFSPENSIKRYSTRLLRNQRLRDYQSNYQNLDANRERGRQLLSITDFDGLKDVVDTKQFNSQLSQIMKTKRVQSEKAAPYVYNIQYSIVNISPTKAYLVVNVTEHSLVACGAWKIDETPDTSTFFDTVDRRWILRGDYVEVENLAPSTTYNIQCKATSKANEASVLSSVQMIITKPAIFEITYAEQHGDYVFVRLNSNMDNTVSCKLLGGSTEGDANEVMITDTMVSFRVDKSHEEYKVGCSAYNQNYSDLIKTEIVKVKMEGINWMKPLSYILLISIATFIVIAAILYRRKKSLRSIYHLDDSEIVSLLEKTVDRRNTGNKSSHSDSLIFDNDSGIRCKKCGFSNPPSATVCRDCNNLLKGNDVFTRKD